MRRTPTARDLSVSQNNLGDFHLKRGAAGDADTARQYYEAALATRSDLYERNRDSAQAARDVCVSLYKLANFFEEQGDEASERSHAERLHAMLSEMVARGFEPDASMQNLYEQLQQRFAAASESPSPATERPTNAWKGAQRPTHAAVAAKLLRDGASFFETLGEQNASLQDQMGENAQVFRGCADLVEPDPEGRIASEDLGDAENGEASHAGIAAKLLRDAADFFDQLGAQNAALKEQMDENAAVYRRAADLVESDPHGELQDDGD